MGYAVQPTENWTRAMQLFWIGNHFEADIRQNFADILSKAIEQGYTKEMLADTLKDQFNDIQIEELAGALQHHETEPKNGFPGDFACKGFRVWRKEIRNGSSSG